MSMKSFYTTQGVIQHENDSTGDHDRDYIDATLLNTVLILVAYRSYPAYQA